MTYTNKKLMIILIYIFFILILLFFDKIKYVITIFIIFIISIIIVLFSLLEGNDYTRKYILETLNSSYKKYEKDVKEYREFLLNSKEFSELNTIKSFKEERISVLIIGESHSKYHSSIYGYFRETMPNMEKLLKNKEIMVFNNVITPQSSTRAALTEVLTLKSNNGDSNFYDYPSVIDIYKKAGFKTYWISNQENYGVAGNFAALIANKCDEVKYTETYNSDSRKLKKYDEYVLPLLDQVLKENERQKFIVIHLLGNHFRYDERTPHSYKIYKDINKNFNKF